MNYGLNSQAMIFIALDTIYFLLCKFIEVNLHELCFYSVAYSFATGPDHWRSKQSSKESTYKDFHTMFGSSDKKSTRLDGFLANTSDRKSNKKNVKEVSEEIGHSLGSAASFLSASGSKRKPNKGKQKSKKNARIDEHDGGSKRKKKF